ncbi:RNA polymerase sigma factor [Microbacterium sp. NPDC087665]|uniref:RNA polymerase sigma factor n=1 Tax=Microbacterium sp. NPDC087665 TaxID=3364194 RepID=UPI0037F846EC
MRRARERESVFDEMIRRNEADLLAYFQRRTLDGADAADAFGELLLVAWKRSAKIPTDPEAARMWMFVAARNVLQNSRRSAQRSRRAVQRLAEAMMTTTPAGDADDDALTVRAAIDALPAEDAELVRLIYWDGFASHEAAAILGVNASTARSRLAKAKERLRVALSPELTTQD